MEIYIAKDGQKHGPYTEAQLQEYVKSGRVRPNDLAWKSGYSKWISVSQMLPAAVNPGGSAQPPPVSDIRLWNPMAAILWSLLFTPAFGAFLHAQNWRALGDKPKATANLGYAWGIIAITLILLLVSFLFPDLPAGATNGVGFALLGGWIFSSGRKQVQHVKAHFPNGYAKRPIWKALVIAAALFAVYIVLVVVLALIFSSSSAQ